MTPFVAEIIGTMLMILLGNGVVANVVLKDTKGNNSGWIVITTAWALAVFVGVTVAGPVSGAHLNPAVTLGLAFAGKFSWDLVPTYIAGEMIGAMLGAFLVWLFNKDHFAITEDEGAKLACFSTGPAIRKPLSNIISEIIGTFVLVFVKRWCFTCYPFGLGNWIVLRRNNGICHQSGQRSRAKNYACHSSRERKQ